jgi:hypothetical protein
MNLLQEKISPLLDYSHEVTGLDRFILYGGIPLDLMIHGSYHDIDLATQGKNEEHITELNERFVTKGFDILESRRPYHIRNGLVEVILVYAKNDKDFFDVCFMDDLSMVGLFDIESSYWRFPERDYVDQHNAVEALEAKCIRPIRSFQEENPLLWLSRFVRLCSKYDIPMTGIPAHLQTIESIRTGLDYTPFSYDSPQYHSAVSSIMKSIVGASNRQLLVTQLVETGFIEKLMPELEACLKDLREEELDMVRDREDLSCVIKRVLDPDKRKVFEKRLQSLNYRNWD